MLEGRSVSAIALTHAHDDHAGAMKRLADRFGVPVWCGARDREAAETGRVVLAPAFRRPRLNALVGATAGFEGAPVARTLAEGDALAAGFTVLDTPGHSPGHVSFWREADRTLICGDVFFNMHLLTTIPGLRQPPASVHDRPGGEPAVRAQARRARADHRRLRSRARPARRRRAGSCATSCRRCRRASSCARGARLAVSARHGQRRRYPSPRRRSRTSASRSRPAPSTGRSGRSRSSWRARATSRSSTARPGRRHRYTGIAEPRGARRTSAARLADERFLELAPDRARSTCPTRRRSRSRCGKRRRGPPSRLPARGRAPRPRRARPADPRLRAARRARHRRRAAVGLGGPAGMSAPGREHRARAGASAAERGRRPGAAARLDPAGRARPRPAADDRQPGRQRPDRRRG